SDLAMVLVEAGKRPVQVQGFMNSLLHKGLHGALPKHRQHIVIESAAKTFDPCEAYSFDNNRLAVQYMDIFILHHLPDKLVPYFLMLFFHDQTVLIVYDR